MNTPDYLVIRAAPDLPPGFLSPSLDGKWIDRSQLPEDGWPYRWGDAVAVASGRFEAREDGAVAEVFEVRP